MATRDSASISATPGEIIALYELDLTVIGVSEILYFTGSTSSNPLPITFQGVQYTPIELKSSGWTQSGTGPFPQPKIQVSNVNNLFSGLVRQYQDLIGAKLTRKRLFASFLDGYVNGGQAGNALFAVDQYYLYQKTGHNKLYVEWKLASAIDQEGQQLPSRLVIRDSCQFQYRVWNPNTGAFDYTHVDCPYTGSATYNNTNQADAAQNDACDHTTIGCTLRFSIYGYLPFGGYPGVGN